MNWVRNDLTELAESKKVIYQNNAPFPHIAIDNVFSPDKLNKVLSEFPAIEETVWKRHVHKFSLKLALNDRDKMGSNTQKFISYLNEPEFLAFLEKMTGIEGLVPDPYLEGGGLHQITTGGYLGIHADFNFHEKIKLHRRINLLVYLNHDWKEEYGSHLELWDKKMKKSEVKVLPIFNRMVVFNTTDTAYHGHPDPLKSPDHISRKSIALYYYTATRPKAELSESHTTIYKARPNEPASRTASKKKRSTLAKIKNRVSKFINRG